MGKSIHIPVDDVFFLKVLVSIRHQKVSFTGAGE